MTTPQAMKTSLEKVFSDLSGCPVELTIRGELEFTISTDGNQVVNLQKVVRWFGSMVKAVCSYDEETDLTCLYIDCILPPVKGQA